MSVLYYMHQTTSPDATAIVDFAILAPHLNFNNIFFAESIFYD